MLEKLIKQEEKKWEQRVHLNSRHFDATSNDKNSNNNWNDENKNKFSFIIHKMFGQKKEKCSIFVHSVEKNEKKTDQQNCTHGREKKMHKRKKAGDHKIIRLNMYTCDEVMHIYIYSLLSVSLGDSWCRVCVLLFFLYFFFGCCCIIVILTPMVSKI